MLRKLLFIALMASLLFACAPATATNTPIVVPTSTPVNVTPILDGATQIREERTYLVTLKFKKEELTLDLWKQLENEAKAEHHTLLVGQRTYDSWTVGQELSDKFDGAGLLFNGEIASYVVSVEDKEVSSQYFWQDKSGDNHEITADEYSAATRELALLDNVITIPFSGLTVTYVLDRPVNEVVCESSKPLMRYFVKVLVKNESITLDLSKLIRNATNVHHIEMEVTQTTFDKAAVGEAWEPNWNVGSIVFSGRLSRLHGYVEDRWTEEDPSFNLCVADGEELILPAK